MNWISLGLLLLQVLGGASLGPAPGAPPAAYAGWAAEAYPDLSSEQMDAMVGRMAEAGANVLWIGHNNPGEVTPDKLEPGLSYAVYEAYRDPSSRQHSTAVAIVQAQHRILAACRAAHIQAVLPVGYQIQMGEAWNAKHPDALRRDAKSEPLNIYGGGVSASFYAPSYQQAIETYYRWVESEFVAPYADVVLMLNLADEPIGGDYSSYAEAEFRTQTGFGFAEVGDAPERLQLLGAFQSLYVVKYATFSADLWQKIHPGLLVTISFDGGQARRAFALPEVEALFRDTPLNLVITFDAYPHDGLPNEPASDADLTGLFLLTRSLGSYSARYGRPVWLWAAANSWGLSQASPDPGTVSDALANGLSLALLVRQGGGDLRGIVYWSYNVRQQGLYDNAGSTAYRADDMFHQVSRALPALRRLTQARIGTFDVVILAPDAWAHRQIGVTREAVRQEPYPYTKLTLLAQSGSRTVAVGKLDETWLATARTVLVLGASADTLSAHDRSSLVAFLERGGNVVASPAVAADLQAVTRAPAGRPISGTLQGPEGLDLRGHMEQQGNLFVAYPNVADLLQKQWRDLLAPVWQRVLKVRPLEPAYRIVTERLAFYYNLGPEPVTWQLRFPFEGSGFRYNGEGRAVEQIRGPVQILTLARREYVVIWRVRLGRWIAR